MELSKRLQAVADLVTAGYITADIGTDHAYIPIYLVGEGRIPGAIASDVNEGPLERARAHVAENGLEDRIDLRISDGFSAIHPGEARSAVIAGMGGGLVMRILREGGETARRLSECVLQPQSEIEKVRTFLNQEGFLFTDEVMVEEEGKFYLVMKVIPPDESKNMEKEESLRKQGQWSDVELRYGKLLLEKKDPVLLRFLERELRIKKEILSSLEGKGSERIDQRRSELKKEIEYIEKGMEYYAL